MSSITNLIKRLPRRAKEEESRRLSLRTFTEPLAYLLPFFIGLAIFTLFPIVNVFMLSFKEGYRMLTGEFSQYGLGNFAFILKDPYFINSLQNTAIYVFTVVPVSTVLAIFFAYMLNKKLRLNPLYQTAFFLPMVTSVIAVGLAWKWIFNFDYGVFNFFLSQFNIDPINWLNNPRYNLWTIIIYGIWSYLPFTIILLLSGLQNIDPMYSTAARVDGASKFKIFFRITLPLLAPTVGLVLIVNVISASKVFNELFPLFNGRPGVAYNLYTVVYYIYEVFYVKWRLGQAGAAAVILFLIVLIFTMVQLYLQRNWKHY
jgi:multiple sugar transport system permease protein